MSLASAYLAGSHPNRSGASLIPIDVPAWGEPGCPLLPAFLRAWLAEESAPDAIVDWLGQKVTCAALDSHVWAATTRLLEPTVLRALADHVAPWLEELGDIRPLPAIEALGTLIDVLPLRTRTNNALRREQLDQPESHLEAVTIGELLDIPAFGAVSLLDLLCVMEAALASSTATLVEHARQQVSTSVDLAAWGSDGVPLLPAIFRYALDELAPDAAAEWIGRPTLMRDLGEGPWESQYGAPDVTVLRAIAEAAVPAVAARSSFQPFVHFTSVGPALRSLPLRTRTRNALDKAGYFDEGGDVERVTIGQLVTLPGFGVVSLVDLLCTAEAGLPKLGFRQPSGNGDGDVSVHDLKTVAAWAVGEHAAETVEQALALTGAERPTEVKAAWDRTMRFDLRSFAGDQAATYSPRHVLDEFMQTLDDRDRAVLTSRVLAPKSTSTLDELARKFGGLSRARIGQIETRLRARVADLGPSPIGRLATQTAVHLGTAVPADSVFVDAFLAPFGEDCDDIAVPLLLHLGGPYRYRDGWLIQESCEPRVTGTKQALFDACDARGIVDGDAISDVLEAAGIRPQWHNRWVLELAAFRAHDGAWLRWDGNTLDRLERMLRLAGQPLTAEELLSLAGEDLNPRGMRQRMMNDPRFVRINKQAQFAVPEWGYDEYTGVTDEIAQEIQRCGGTADAEHLVQYVSSTYGVAESSVRAYLTAPMFVRSPTGAVRVRGEDDERVLVDRDLTAAPDACRTASGWALRIEIDADVLRGSGRALSSALASHVGVGPGEKRAFPTDHGEVTVSWPVSSITGPSIGSVRSEVTALDGAAGDWLFLTFDTAKRRFASSVVSAADIAASTGLRRLALLHGVGAGRPEPELLADVAAALGLTLGQDDDPARAVETALTRRRQERWRDLVPQQDGEDSVDDVLERLTRALS